MCCGIPTRWLPSWGPKGSLHPSLARDLRAVDYLSRKLARATFYAMLFHGPKLERRQLLLGQLVDIGAELFAWSTAIARAQSYYANESGTRKPEEIAKALDLARLQGGYSREVIRQAFTGLFFNEDSRRYRVTTALLERGMLGPLMD